MGSIVEVSSKNGGEFFEMVNAVCGGAQEMPRRVRHVRERGYPVACEQSETRGGEFEGLGCAERDHGVSLTLVGNDDSPLTLGENVAAVVTPAG